MITNTINSHLELKNRNIAKAFIAQGLCPVLIEYYDSVPYVICKTDNNTIEYYVWCPPKLIKDNQDYVLITDLKEVFIKTDNSISCQDLVKDTNEYIYTQSFHPTAVDILEEYLRDKIYTNFKTFNKEGYLSIELPTNDNLYITMDAKNKSIYIELAYRDEENLVLFYQHYLPTENHLFKGLVGNVWLIAKTISKFYDTDINDNLISIVTENHPYFDNTFIEGNYTFKELMYILKGKGLDNIKMFLCRLKTFRLSTRDKLTNAEMKILRETLEDYLCDKVRIIIDDFSNHMPY